MDRVVIVTKPTRLEDLVREHLTEGAAEFNFTSRGQSIAPYRAEDETYRTALAEVRRQIPNDLSVAEVSRGDLPHFLFRPTDLIVVCGPDGLFVNAAKYLGSQPVLAVNPDPSTVMGALMLFPPSSVGSVIAQVRAKAHRVERLPFVRALIDEERVVWGINDLFIGRTDHISARYALSFGTKKERQSSSGIIVSTGVGSTGWMRSVAAMAAGLIPEGTSHRLSSLPTAAQNELVFVVREPYPSPSTGATLVTGRVRPGAPLTAVSEMPHGGAIFSDGVVEQALEWNAGSTVAVSVGDRYVERIVP
jgi:NAD kinase